MGRLGEDSGEFAVATAAVAEDTVAVATAVASLAAAVAVGTQGQSWLVFDNISRQLQALLGQLPPPAPPCHHPMAQSPRAVLSLSMVSVLGRRDRLSGTELDSWTVGTMSGWEQDKQDICWVRSMVSISLSRIHCISYTFRI